MFFWPSAQAATRVQIPVQLIFFLLIVRLILIHRGTTIYLKIVYVLPYRLFKDKFCFEHYLITLRTTFNLNRRNLLSFRLSHPTTKSDNLKYQEVKTELCSLCNNNDIGDEFHYSFICTYSSIKDNRSLLLPKYRHDPNVMKLRDLMNIKSRFFF